MTANTGRARHVDNSFGGTAFGPFSITYGTGQVRCITAAIFQHVVALRRRWSCWGERLWSLRHAESQFMQASRAACGRMPICKRASVSSMQAYGVLR